MSDIKISQLPVAGIVNDADIVVLNQSGTTKTAAKSLIVAGLTNTAQVNALVTQGIAGVTPASIGAISTDAASGFATTDQISGFTNSAQVEALASAQIAAITPASIGAVATSAVIAIDKGGTGATDAPSALAALGGITSAQVPAFDTQQLNAYVLKAGSTMDGRLIMAATTAQAKANIGGFLTGAAVPASVIPGDIWVSNQSKLSFSPSSGVTVNAAGLQQANTYNQQQTIGVGGTSTSLVVTQSGTGRAATFAAASTAAAVAITQTGAGEAFRVEDETSPDATPFVISSAGRVGIGVAPDAVTALSVDSGGIKFADGSIATTALSGVTTAQVSAIASSQIAAITPASIGALSTDAASGFATTSQISGLATTGQLSGFATTTDIQGIAFTSQLSGFATTDQISGFTNSAQVEALASAQIAAITPASIGAVATDAIIAIDHGGTGAFTANDALTNLGAMPVTQTAGGDLSGTLTSPNVVKLYGYPISNSGPFGGAVLQYNGSVWEPASINTGTVTSVSVGSELSVDGLPGGTITSSGTITIANSGVTPGLYGSSTQVAVLDVNNIGQITSAYNAAITPAGIGALDATAAAGGDLTGNYPNPTVAKLQGYDVSSSVPTSGQVLTWNGSAWVATAPAAGGSGGGGVLFYLNYGTNPDAPAPAGSKELGRVAEVAQTSVQSAVLTSGVWTDIAGFVSDTLDPNLQDIPAGIFDFNVWAKSDANANAPTLLRVQVYKWDGTTSTSIATSGTAVVSNNGTTVQTAISVVIPQTDVTPSDRLYIVLQVQASAAGHTATIEFGDGTPSHVHTTIPSVGGTGVVKVINGVPQNPASLITDSDVSTAAPLALDKVQMGQVSVLTVDGLTGGGDLSTTRILSLTTTGVSALSYGSSTQISAFTVDAYGRLTAASNVAISAAGIGAQPALTTAAPLGIELGGTGATTALAALTALGNMHFVGGWSQTSVVTGTMDTGVTPNTFTVTATGALSVDSGSPVAGDIVVFTSQPTASQHLGRDNGPWVVVNPGAVGVQATFVRPAWFSGTVKTGMLVSNQYGTNRTGVTYAIQGPTTLTSGDFINVGTDILNIFTVYQRASNSVLSANSYSGRQTFTANTATVNPINFSTAAATLLSTRQLGAIEWDNTQLYITSSTQFAALNRNAIATATVLINTQTGTTFAPALTDAGRLITLSNASAIAVTIAADATTDFPVGTQLLLMQLGAGQVTVSGAVGVTIVSRSGTKTAGQYALISLIKVAANQWVVGGDATT